MRTGTSRLGNALFLATVLSAVGTAGFSADLEINIGPSRVVTTAELLARPDATTITVPTDASYGRAMSYRAVPLRSLLGLSAPPAGQNLRLVASDGFVTNLPASLVFAPSDQGAEPWLAIEPPDHPWPKTPGGNATGPFYLVWLHPEASGILREQWPFAVEALDLAPSPSSRWPRLALSDAVPAESLVAKGQALVESQCMVCHPVAGAGDAAVGPDLNRPRSPTEYFEPWAFKAYIRDPAALRSWAGMRMPGFPEEVLGDQDLDAIIAYLAYLAERRSEGATP